MSDDQIITPVAPILGSTEIVPRAMLFFYILENKVEKSPYNSSVKKNCEELNKMYCRNAAYISYASLGVGEIKKVFEHSHNTFGCEH